jgi:hypothetical protein
MSIPKKILGEFLSYLRLPSYNFDFEHNPKPFLQVLQKVCSLFFLTFTVSIFCSIISNLVVEKIGYYGKSVNTVSEPIWLELLVGALLTSIVEELCFRLYLKFSPVGVALLSFGSGLWISLHFIRASQLTFPSSLLYAIALSTIVAVCFF